MTKKTARIKIVADGKVQYVDVDMTVDDPTPATRTNPTATPSTTTPARPTPARKSPLGCPSVGCLSIPVLLIGIVGVLFVCNLLNSVDTNMKQNAARSTQEAVSGNISITALEKACKEGATECDLYLPLYVFTIENRSNEDISFQASITSPALSYENPITSIWCEGPFPGGYVFTMTAGSSGTITCKSTDSRWDAAEKRYDFPSPYDNQVLCVRYRYEEMGPAEVCKEIATVLVP